MGEYVKAFTAKQPEVFEFLTCFKRLSEADKLTFLAIIFDRIDKGMINSENAANNWEIIDNGYILTPIDCSLDNCASLAFNLVYMANNYHNGSYPDSCLIDCLDTWIKRTHQLDKTEILFNKMPFEDKLYSLVELFCCIGDNILGVSLNTFGIDSYLVAHRILSFISDINSLNG